MLLFSKTLQLAGTRKLRARFVGHFRVMERIGKTEHRLDLKGRFKSICNVFHVFSAEETHPWRLIYYFHLRLIQVEGKEYFEVEALLKHRSRGNSW